MSINEIMELCTDPICCHVAIWDTEKGCVAWEGHGNDIPEEYGDLPFKSFDVSNNGTFNINI